ncbi:CoA ester lyase [Paenarthrobacter sp. NPDC089316]|uniref:HpcH/HpaI aldolase/citrate lyase family protein n=1 Tax=unclassified Paenarthrobacter TaxID=2634190 RepID=UPI003428DC4B
MKPYRSMLFVPGHRASWADKGVASGADALILDLEDSVPNAEKLEARSIVGATIDRLTAEGVRPDLWVRANPDETGLLGGDLEAVVRPGLAGLFLAKVYDARDIVRLDAVLSHLEQRINIEVGTVKLIVCYETATSMAQCEEIAAASPRVASLLGATGPNADAGRELGIEFTTEGLETLYMRSRIVLAARSNGLTHPLVGVWQDIQDIEGCQEFCKDNRRLGYRGLVAIHPSHVAIANDVFAPSAATVDQARRLIDAFRRAEESGSAAINFEGQHVDIAHVKTAEGVIALADALAANV